MTPEERAGMAAAITEAIALACAAVRQEHAESLAVLRSEFTAQVEVARSLEQRCERAEGRAEQLQRDLDAVRDLAAEPPIRSAVMDAAGVAHFVQRSGPNVTMAVADLDEIIDAAVTTRLGPIVEAIRAEMMSEVARSMQRLGTAPRWTRMAIYGQGAVVSCYIGRTYELKPGVKASMAQEPGLHPEVWDRIGSHGLRVMKSKPEQAQPGDWYTDADARFISDGEEATLFVPRMLKQRDVERLHNALEAKLQAMFRSTAAEIGEARSAANDAVNGAAPYQQWLEKHRQLLERVIARLDDLDNLFDQGTGS